MKAHQNKEAKAMNDVTKLIEEARLDAKAFRENTVYDSEGDPIRLIANAERLDAYAAALTTARAEAEALRADAERWRAFYGSERFYVMGAAGFDWEKSAVREPRDETNWLHFTLNVWDRHPAGNDKQGVQGRAMLLSYVDHLRSTAALASEPGK